MRKQKLHEIRLMVKDSLPHWIKSIEFWEEHDEEFDHDSPDIGYLLLTVGTNDWRRWGYQTGDNTLPGGAQGFKHRAEVCVWPEATVDDLVEEIASQLDESMHKRSR